MDVIKVEAPNGDLLTCELDERWEDEGNRMTGWLGDVYVMRPGPTGGWDEVAVFSDAIDIERAEDPESTGLRLITCMANMWPGMVN